MIPTQEGIVAAHLRIKPFINRTPLLSCSTLTAECGAESVTLKCENFQKVGAFKARGACNKLVKLKQSGETFNVCTHSSGNHAMALAYMSKVLGFNAYIVMPQNSPHIKKKAVKGYSATIVQSGNTVSEREAMCLRVCEQHDAQLVHAYNDYDVIEGQATCAKQILEETPDLDYLVFPVGGGGLATGTLLSLNYFGNNCRPVAVQPYLARDAYLSILHQHKHPQLPPVTVADGLRVNLGDKNFSAMKQYLQPEDIILVSEEEIISATQFIFERMKMVIQPSSATVVAAVRKDPRFRHKKVSCIISGGNIDLSGYFEGLRARL